MSDKIVLFLAENPGESFKAGEIARRLDLLKGDVKKRLKRLAKQGKIQVSNGRYRAKKAVVSKKQKPRRIALPTLRKSGTASWLEETARTVGISTEILERWVEERKKKATDDEAEKLIYGVLDDLERSKGTWNLNRTKK